MLVKMWKINVVYIYYISLIKTIKSNNECKLFFSNLKILQIHFRYFIYVFPLISYWAIWINSHSLLRFFTSWFFGGEHPEHSKFFISIITITTLISNIHKLCITTLHRTRCYVTCEQLTTNKIMISGLMMNRKKKKWSVANKR